jgi:hypothetical protein
MLDEELVLGSQKQLAAGGKQPPTPPVGIASHFGQLVNYFEAK